MNADDLGGLLATTPAADTSLPELGIHVGEVLAWDVATGESTISIAGTPVDDLPFLNIGDTTNLSVGDAVTVLRSKSAYFVLGRIVTPNTNTFASAATSFQPVYEEAQGFAFGPGDATVVSTNLIVPPWANFCSVTLSHLMTARNSTAGHAYLYVSVWLQAMSATSPQNLQGAVAGGYCSAAASITASGAVTPGSTMQVEGRAATSGAVWTASGFNLAYVSGLAIFTKV